MKTVRVIKAMFLTPCFCFALWLISGFTTTAYWSATSAFWPKVHGTLLSYTFRDTFEEWELVLEYRYSYNGTSFQGRRLSFIRGNGLSIRSKNITQPYLENEAQNLVVRVCPRTPSQCRLETGDDPDGLATGLIAMSISAIIAAYLVWFMIELWSAPWRKIDPTKNDNPTTPEQGVNPWS